MNRYQSARQSVELLFGRNPGEKFAPREREPRVPPIRRDFDEWDQDEPPFVQPRVR